MGTSRKHREHVGNVESDPMNSVPLVTYKVLTFLDQVLTVGDHMWGLEAVWNHGERLMGALSEREVLNVSVFLWNFCL
jgi:hypothetical protein